MDLLSLKITTLVLGAFSFLVILLGFPGSFFLAAAAVAFKIFFNAGNWFTIILLVLLAVVSEIIEFFSGVLALADAKPEKFSGLLSIVGGVFGGIIGTGVFPILGTFFGGLFGAFFLVFINEILRGKPPKEAQKISSKVMLGMLYGRISKVIICGIMTGMLFFSL